jgi:pimeloyl-ACP methyl ester carboxylesterase
MKISFDTRLRYLRQLKAMAALERHDGLPNLRSVGCPTLFIHGRQDGVFSLAEHKEIAGAIPKALAPAIAGRLRYTPALPTARDQLT